MVMWSWKLVAERHGNLLIHGSLAVWRPVLLKRIRMPVLFLMYCISTWYLDRHSHSKWPCSFWLKLVWAADERCEKNSAFACVYLLHVIACPRVSDMGSGLVGFRHWACWRARELDLLVSGESTISDAHVLIDKHPGDLQEALRANFGSESNHCLWWPQSEQACTLEAMDVHSEEASPKLAVASRFYDLAGSMPSCSAWRQMVD